VPVMASVKIIAGHLWRTRVLGQSWEEVTEALIDENPTGDTFFSRIREAEAAEDEDAMPGETGPEADLHS